MYLMLLNSGCEASVDTLLTLMVLQRKCFMFLCVLFLKGVKAAGGQK